MPTYNTTQPPPTPHPEPQLINTNRADLQRYHTIYNQNLLESIAPENIPEWGEYHDTGGEVAMLKRMFIHNRYPFMFEGPKGTGKTHLVSHVCKEQGRALVEVRCNENTKERHLFGSPQIDEHGSFFMAGKLAHAFKALDIYDKVVIHFDDLGALSVEEQIALLPLCDKRRSIEVNGVDMFVPKGKQLSIIATTNPATYAGINPIQEALRSRFIGKIMTYPKRESLIKIIDWDGIPEDDVKEPLLTLASNTHDLKQKNNVDYVLSPRDIIQFVDLYNDNIAIHGLNHLESLAECINLCILVKYTDAQERELIRIRCQETFGVTI
jgi:MoxR-like ATPase